jgi:hypothetical protein
MISVYHADPPDFLYGCHWGRDIDPWDGQTRNYVHVADVDVPDEHFEVAFRLTNHILDNWELNPGVTPIFIKGAFETGHRSTSVGDVIRLSSGEFRRVLNIGWQEDLMAEEVLLFLEAEDEAAKIAREAWEKAGEALSKN